MNLVYLHACVCFVILFLFCFLGVVIGWESKNIYNINGVSAQNISAFTITNIWLQLQSYVSGV